MKRGDRKEFLLQYPRLPVANPCHGTLIFYADSDLTSIHTLCAVSSDGCSLASVSFVSFSLLATRECRDWGSFGAELMLHSVEVPSKHCDSGKRKPLP